VVAGLYLVPEGSFSPKIWGVVSTVCVVISLLLGDAQVLHVIALLAPSTLYIKSADAVGQGQGERG